MREDAINKAKGSDNKAPDIMYSSSLNYKYYFNIKIYKVSIFQTLLA